MYDYIERHIASNIVEFYVRTAQGHRVVRVDLSNPSNPRITAFNETISSRTPALLYMTEIQNLIDRASRRLQSNKETKD